MSTISLRLPDSLHETVRKLAENENISINQFITLALAEKVSALATEDYLGERAKRGSRQKFERAMAKVPDVEPESHDKLWLNCGRYPFTLPASRPRMKYLPSRM